jgi:hypothetical protein
VISRQIRMLGLSALAVFAVSVVVSASASAHTYVVCKEGGTEKFTEHLCSTKGETGKWSWAAVTGAETFKVEGTSGVIKLENEAFGKALIECKKDSFTGEITAGGVGSGANTFSECAWYEIGTERHKNHISSCTIPNLFFNVTDKLVSGEGFGTEEEFNATGAEGTFVEFKVEGAGCILKGVYKLKQTEVEILPAKQIFKGEVCALPEAAVGKVEHEIVCSSSGSHLTFNGRPAGLSSTETVKLVSGASWAAE